VRHSRPGLARQWCSQVRPTEEHPALLIRSVRSLGVGREVIRVDPVAGERLRRAVLFVRSVGVGQALRRRTLRRPQSTSDATLWRISTSAVTNFGRWGSADPVRSR
jgi:hypothetical protein